MFSFKIVLVGDGGVGKTALRKKFLGECMKTGQYLNAIGADFAIYNTKLDDKDVKFQIWDLLNNLSSIM